MTHVVLEVNLQGAKSGITIYSDDETSSIHGKELKLGVFNYFYWCSLRSGSPWCMQEPFCFCSGQLSKSFVVPKIKIKS